MSSYTLDDIRAAAERKYGSTDIAVGETVCKMVNPLRLPKEKRAALVAMQDANDENDSDAQEQFLRDAIRLVCENEYQANTLIEAIGDDLAVMAEIFETYSAAQQVGEASASAA